MLGRRRKAFGGESPHESLSAMAGAGAALAASRSEADDIFRTIFNHAAVGIWQTTPEGRCLRVNPCGSEMMGYSSPEEMVAAISDIAQQVYVDPTERELLKA